MGAESPAPTQTHLVGAGRSQGALLHAFGGTPRQALAFHAGQRALQHAVAPVGKDHAGAQRALDRGGGQIRAGCAGGKGGDVQAFARGAVPVGRIRRALKGNAAAGEVLRKTAPTGEIQLLGGLELIEIAFQPRPLGQQAEDPPLVEHVDVVLPDHVIDGTQLASIADQQRRQTCETVTHQVWVLSPLGSGMESAKPARNTGWAKPSGATSAAAPRGAPAE